MTSSMGLHIGKTKSMGKGRRGSLLGDLIGNDSSYLQVPRGLAKALREGNCVAFIGAGFSAAAGLPDWGQLLHAIKLKAEASGALSPVLVEEIGAMIDEGTSGSYDRAAQMMEDKLGREMIADVVGSELKPPAKLPESMENRLSLLLGIPFAAILTTNFDYFLPGVPAAHPSSKGVMRDILRSSPLSVQEQVVRQLVIASRQMDNDSDDEDAELRSQVSMMIEDSDQEEEMEAEDTLKENRKDQELADRANDFYKKVTSIPTIQLHGTVVPKGGDGILGEMDPTIERFFSRYNYRADPGLALTRLGYRRLLHGNESYQKFLSSVMATKTVLYIGFSFSDEYINEMRSSTMMMLQSPEEDEEEEAKEEGPRFESAAEFTKRLTELDLGGLHSKFKSQGWTSFAKFAYATDPLPGGGLDPNAFREEILAKVLDDPEDPKKLGIKRLFLEASAMATQDLELRTKAQEANFRPSQRPSQSGTLKKGEALIGKWIGPEGKVVAIGRVGPASLESQEDDSKSVVLEENAEGRWQTSDGSVKFQLEKSGRQLSQLFAGVSLARTLRPVGHQDEEQKHKLLNILQTEAKLKVLFGHLDQRKLREVVNAFYVKDIPQDVDVIKQGDAGHSLYIIDEGFVDIFVRMPGASASDAAAANMSKGVKVAGGWGPGSLFGELSLMHNQPRNATVHATTAVRAFVLDAVDFRFLLAKSDQEPIAYAISIGKSSGEVDFYEQHEGVRMLNYIPQTGAGFEGLDKWLAALVKESNPLYRWCRSLADKTILICAKGKRQGLLRMIHNYAASIYKGKIGKFEFVSPPDEDDACTVEAMTSTLEGYYDEHYKLDAVVVSLKANGHHLAKTTIEAMDSLRKNGKKSPVIVFETASKKYHAKHKAEVLELGAVGYINSLLTLFTEISRVCEAPELPTDLEDTLADGCSQQ